MSDLLPQYLFPSLSPHVRHIIQPGAPRSTQLAPYAAQMRSHGVMSRNGILGRAMNASLRSAGGRGVDSLRKEGGGVNIIDNFMGDKGDCMHTRLPFAYLDGVSERAALAMVEAPVVYAVHIVAPLLLLYAINQV